MSRNPNQDRVEGVTYRQNDINNEDGIRKLLAEIQPQTGVILAHQLHISLHDNATLPTSLPIFLLTLTSFRKEPKAVKPNLVENTVAKGEEAAQREGMKRKRPRREGEDGEGKGKKERRGREGRRGEVGGEEREDVVMGGKKEAWASKRKRRRPARR